MISSLIILLNILLILFINNYFIKKNFLVDEKKLKHKSFISENHVPISGGFLIFINLLIFNLFIVVNHSMNFNLFKIILINFKYLNNYLI